MAEVPAEGTVPSVVAPAVVAHPDIHAVLATCGFANVVDHMSIITMKLFSQLLTLVYWKIMMCLKWLSAWVIAWLWQVV
jgi:hypothetical protein